MSKTSRPHQGPTSTRSLPTASFRASRLALSLGRSPGRAPHFTGGPFPRNFLTGKPYRGINVLLLWSSPMHRLSGSPSNRRRS